MASNHPSSSIDLRARRLERGDTLEEAAEVIGITKKTLSRWERRTVVIQDLDLALRIARYYDVPVQAFAREEAQSVHA